MRWVAVRMSALLFVIGLLLLPLQNAQATLIASTDMTALFGAGAFLVLPDDFGGGTSGATVFTGSGGFSATVEFAVWGVAGTTYIYLYQIQNPTSNVSSFSVGGFGPVASIADPSNGLAGEAQGIGYVELGTYPGVAPIAMAANDGNLAWAFGLQGFSGIPAGQTSRWLFAASLAEPDAVGTGQLVNTVTPSPTGDVPVPTPEPMTLVLLGSGMTGLGLLRWRKWF